MNKTDRNDIDWDKERIDMTEKAVIIVRKNTVKI